MTDLIHQQLLGHLLGALDDAEQERVDALLEQDEQWRRELAQWRRRLAPIEAARPDFEPPRGLGARTCRFVAACMPVPASAAAPRRRMSPNLTPPSRIAGVGWSDVAAVAMLLLTTGALLLPAIHGSRFHMRLATCQDSLRQFGDALTQYGHHHGEPLSRMASHGRLTTAGALAVRRFPEGLLTDRRLPTCPDVWLAVHGVLPGPSAGDARSESRRPGTATAGIIVCLSPGQPARGTITWPGTWRDGTTNDLRLPLSPADVPLLADAPSADLPGQIQGSHGGRGRNVLREDGRVAFVPCAAPHDVVDMVLCSENPSSACEISTPSVFAHSR